MRSNDSTAGAERRRELADCALRFLLTAVLCGARLFGGYAPFVPGMVAAAGAGRRGFAALLGALLGAPLLLDFSHALRTLAVAVLLCTANNAFCETKWYRSRAFLPVMTAAMCLSVEFVYLLQSGIEEAAQGLLSIALAVFVSCCCRAAERETNDERRSEAMLVVVIGVLTAAASVEFAGGFAPGRVPAMLLVMLLAYDRTASTALAAALGIGLAMDLAAQTGGFLHTAVYSFGALAMTPERRKRRVGAALLWCVPLMLLSLPTEAGRGLMLLYEGLCAAFLFLLLPNRLFGGRRLAAEKKEAAESAAEESAERSTARRLHAAAQAMRELYDSLMRTPPVEEENPAMIFDRAAERVCRGCSLRTICWERDYAKTYNALNDATAALLAQGRGRGGDFPSYFTDRCIRFPSFLAAVNAELSAFLLRRQYRRRLADTRAQAAGQYAGLSELLDGTAEALETAGTATKSLLRYRVGTALRAKEGERVSGDSLTHFETEDARLCLLLSDGMGSGEEARRESALAVRLLERFLRAGVEAASALKTLNGALTLRAELSESFTTVDLLLLSLRDGTAESYKYGAAPSYLKRGSRVRRITCSCLPAGLQGAESAPEVTRFALEKNCLFVLVSDGVADADDDGWLLALLEGWRGDDPQALAEAVLREGCAHRGSGDDGAVLVLAIDGADGTAEV